MAGMTSRAVRDLKSAPAKVALSGAVPVGEVSVATRPTLRSAGRPGKVSEPIWVQVWPSEEVWAVMVSPLRTRRTHSQAGVTVVPADDAAAVRRRWKDMPLAEERTIMAWALAGSREARTMIPALAQAWGLFMAVTRTVNSPSPDQSRQLKEKQSAVFQMSPASTDACHAPGEVSVQVWVTGVPMATGASRPSGS